MKRPFARTLEKLLTGREDLLKSDDSLNVTRAARAIGIHQPTLQRMIADGSEYPTPENAKKLTRFLNISHEELIGGKANVSGRESHVAISKSPDSMLIPNFIDVYASLGSGCTPPDNYPDVMEAVSISRAWLSETLGITGIKSKKLTIITGFGDSMAGTINSGDPVLIDTSVQTMGRSGVYVFTLNGELYIKRLQSRVDKTLAMISDSGLYVPEEITSNDDFKVHGKVVYAWNGRSFNE